MAKREYRHDEPNPNDGETTLRLVLSDDGTFVYSWEWCTYAWHVGKDATGRWEESGDHLTLHVIESEIHGMTTPQAVKATRRGDAYAFDGGAVLALVPPPDDPGQRRELELEEEKFQRSLNIKPSKLVK